MSTEVEEAIRRKFIERFGEPPTDGSPMLNPCRYCGQGPSAEMSRRERALWYAAHTCNPEEVKQ